MITLGHAPTPPPASRGAVYLPIIAGSPDPVAEFCRLLIADPRQERPSLSPCPSLVQAATYRARGLANGDPWAHVDAHGVTPNEYARMCGCVLSDEYAAKGNSVESLAAGTTDAAVIFAALANSEKHGPHILGKGWFRSQRHYGIALHEGPGPYRWYWCIMIATCGN